MVSALDREPLVLGCALDHRFAGCDEVKLQDLGEERFVDFTADCGTRDLADRVLAEAGVERRVALEASDVHSLLDLVSFGLGVALVPQSFRVKTDRMRFIPGRGRSALGDHGLTADPTGRARRRCGRRSDQATEPRTIASRPAPDTSAQTRLGGPGTAHISSGAARQDPG